MQVGLRGYWPNPEEWAWARDAGVRWQRMEDVVERGIDAVVVSNHGGRQLDGVPATLDALPEVAEAVGGRVEVLLDGGIRRGADVLKALALGADAVLIGRPFLYGLALAGQDGVEHVLRCLLAELDLAVTLSGYPDPAALGPEALQRF